MTNGIFMPCAIPSMFYLHETPEADLPQKVYLEPTTLCSLHCKICFRHGWIGERLGHMSDECFCAARNQILQIPSVEEVFFGGMGEPLFHPQIVQKDAPVSARWRTYMRDVIRMERDPKSGAQPHLKQVFFFGCDTCT